MITQLLYCSIIEVLLMLSYKRFFRLKVVPIKWSWHLKVLSLIHCRFMYIVNYYEHFQSRRLLKPPTTPHQEFIIILFLCLIIS
jgi:hypothetical protein